MKKVTEKVHTIHVGCELCYGPYLSKDFPKKEDVKSMKEAYCGEFFGRPYPGPGRYRAGASGYFVTDENKPTFQEKRKGMDETVENFMAESTKRHEETEVLIMEIPASTDAALRNQGASNNTTETQVGEIYKVIQERFLVICVTSNDEEASRRYVLPKPKPVVEPYRPPIPFLIRLVEVKSVDQDKKFLSSLKKIVDQHPYCGGFEEDSKVHEAFVGLVEKPSQSSRRHISFSTAYVYYLDIVDALVDESVPDVDGALTDQEYKIDKVVHSCSPLRYDEHGPYDVWSFCSKDLGGYCNEGNLVEVYHSSIGEIHMEDVDDAAQVNEELAEDVIDQTNFNATNDTEFSDISEVDEVMRYTVGLGEQSLTIKTSEYEELPRIKENVTGIIVGLMQEMVEGVFVKRAT
ncbi:hypothetical protein Tco_0802246 [Tanacetum coccineum]|uniref:Uncharacterized protein n=1 Tax=Tanacetum coccineum TaxID=301880 RepID=A0ABQ4ZYF6_9ASTR